MDITSWLAIVCHAFRNIDIRSCVSPGSPVPKSFGESNLFHELLKLAKFAPGITRYEVVQQKDRGLRQGFGYNEFLGEWVSAKRKPERIVRKLCGLSIAQNRSS